MTLPIENSRLAIWLSEMSNERWDHDKPNYHRRFQGILWGSHSELRSRFWRGPSKVHRSAPRRSAAIVLSCLGPCVARKSSKSTRIALVWCGFPAASGFCNLGCLQRLDSGKWLLLSPKETNRVCFFEKKNGRSKAQKHQIWRPGPGTSTITSTWWNWVEYSGLPLFSSMVLELRCCSCTCAWWSHCRYVPAGLVSCSLQIW